MTDLVPGQLIEVAGEEIVVDEVWQLSGSRERVQQIAQEMRLPLPLSPDPTGFYRASDTANPS